MRFRMGMLTAVMVSAVGLATAADDKKDENPLDGIKCPVSGAQVKDQAIEYRGATLSFCCPNCVKAFGKDMKKFSAKANFQLVATGQAEQVGCVFCKKEALVADTELEVGGVTIQFGCPGCRQAVEDAEDKVEAAFNDKQFENGFKIKAKKKD